MIFKSKYPVGCIKTETRFALFPVQISLTETIWLERYEVDVKHDRLIDGARFNHAVAIRRLNKPTENE